MYIVLKMHEMDQYHHTVLGCLTHLLHLLQHEFVQIKKKVNVIDKQKTNFNVFLSPDVSFANFTNDLTSLLKSLKKN